eukprot:scaffold146_cov265-Pinguiococcus_pyrenoidosus.AAC.16
MSGPLVSSQALPNLDFLFLFLFLTTTVLFILPQGLKHEIAVLNLFRGAFLTLMFFCTSYAVCYSLDRDLLQTLVTPVGLYRVSKAKILEYKRALRKAAAPRSTVPLVKTAVRRVQAVNTFLKAMPLPSPTSPKHIFGARHEGAHRREPTSLSNSLSRPEPPRNARQDSTLTLEDSSAHGTPQNMALVRSCARKAATHAQKRRLRDLINGTVDPAGVEEQLEGVATRLEDRSNAKEHEYHKYRSRFDGIVSRVKEAKTLLADLEASKQVAQTELKAARKTRRPQSPANRMANHFAGVHRAQTMRMRFQNKLWATAVAAPPVRVLLPTFELTEIDPRRTVINAFAAERFSAVLWKLAMHRNFHITAAVLELVSLSAIFVNRDDRPIIALVGMRIIGDHAAC